MTATGQESSGTLNREAAFMNDNEKQRLLAEFPEAPPWVLTRSYKEAREAMRLRREAFPVTVPQSCKDVP